ncbi:MAG TPA: hypothetical protein VM889_06630 [Candidatus Thermoplasmatota archaeon]|nr:hypothetical protein [Candidatus Thermoplasmatota archaeon]
MQETLKDVPAWNSLEDALVGEGCEINFTHDPILNPSDRCVFTCAQGTPISAHISWQPGAPKYSWSDDPMEATITASCGGVETSCQSEAIYNQQYYSHSECESPEAMTITSGIGTCVITTPLWDQNLWPMQVASTNAVNWIQGGCRSTAMQVNNVVDLVLEDVEEVDGQVRATYSGAFPECREPPYLLPLEPAPDEGCYIDVSIEKPYQYDIVNRQETDQCIPDGEIGHCIVRMEAIATTVNFNGPMGWLTCDKGTTVITGPGVTAQCIRSGTNILPGASFPVGRGNYVVYYHSFKLPPGASCTLRFAQVVGYGFIQPVHDGSVLDYGSNAANPALSAEFVVRNGAGASGPCPAGIPYVV